MDSNDLPQISKKVRRQILEMIYQAGSGHLAGSLSSTDLLVSLYFGGILNKNDKFVLSCGHYAPALYAVLARAGYFPVSKLKTYSKLNSPLQGHPERFRLPGIETTSGPLGCGLAQAAGIALASRMDNAHFRVYCTVSDAEHDEGNHWEAVLFAAKYKLSNLTVFVDRNNIQIEGPTETTLPLEPLRAKYEAFNWKVVEIDGHNMAEIIAAVAKARAEDSRPTAIIAHTVAGKGVAYMEGKSEWHTYRKNVK